MVYQLIADAGSTKTDWIVISATDGSRHSFTTEGINAALASDQEILRVLGQASSQTVAGYDISKIWFYGAGCATPGICRRMEGLLTQAFGCADAEAASDLTGAARALLGHQPGIACILGTGSNSCLYDGTDITANVPSLGFILGDEGSGSALGKRLIADAFKQKLPREAATKFNEEFGITVGDVIENVYRKPAPNRYLASFAPFLRKNIDLPCIRSMVREEFEKFFIRNVASYSCADKLPVCFTGSIAANFEDVLREAAGICGFTVGTILPSPASALAIYHIN